MVVHVKASVCLKYGSNMFLFSGYKVHSGGRAKEGLESGLERIGQFVQRHNRAL